MSRTKCKLPVTKAAKAASVPGVVDQTRWTTAEIHKCTFHTGDTGMMSSSPYAQPQRDAEGLSAEDRAEVEAICFGPIENLDAFLQHSDEEMYSDDEVLAMMNESSSAPEFDESGEEETKSENEEDDSSSNDDDEYDDNNDDPGADTSDAASETPVSITTALVTPVPSTQSTNETMSAQAAPAPSDAASAMPDTSKVMSIPVASTTSDTSTKNAAPAVTAPAPPAQATAASGGCTTRVSFKGFVFTGKFVYGCFGTTLERSTNDPQTTIERPWNDPQTIIEQFSNDP